MTDPLDLLPAVPAPEELAFAYSLGNHGWASLEISLGRRSFSVQEFGDTTDGLGDLVRAGLLIATGDRYADLIFDGEPQRWGLAIEPAGLSPANARLARLTLRNGGTSLKDDGHSNRRVWQWDAHPVAFEGYVTTDEFARAILVTAREARMQFDDATYRERWGYYGSLEGFPLRGLHALEAALATIEYRE